MSQEPFTHKVIRASAGSGKTHQLTNRYIGLLAEGVEPDAILATTFTRKAAGEILDRVLERLASAAANAGKAKELADAIGKSKLGQKDFGQLLRQLLGRLHRLRISTLDSFYIALAGHFSLELGLPAGWSICDESDDEKLRQDALENLLEEEPEVVGKLIALLSKGDVKRSIHEDLLEVIGLHYEAFCDSQRSAWERVQAPAGVGESERMAALEGLRGFDFSACKHKNFIKAQEGDVHDFENKDWLSFIGGGMAAKVLAGEDTYCKKPIPAAAKTIYQILLQHAKSEILRLLSEQTKATWGLLDHFDRHLKAVKQTTGAMRFGEVTLAVAAALQRQAPAADALGFRLDGAIEHLLLDEFQDTSLAQWRVLQPIAQGITGSVVPSPRSFFCVGDVKQAIYRWRGGLPKIFDTLQSALAGLHEEPMDISQRSAQPIIDLVNRVFGGFDQFEASEKCTDGLTEWHKRFREHATAKKNIPGYVCLHSGPAQQDDQDVNSSRSDHYRYVAGKVKEIHAQAPAAGIGVLCRTNAAIAHMIFELRRLNVEASEEGGNPLTDSPAVELLLSLFTLADHPDHTVAWFHILHSPLYNPDESLMRGAETLARHLRGEILRRGYGPFTYSWAKRVAPVCDRRDLGRLQQLVEMAYAYQSRSTLRTMDFVQWVRSQKVPDPSGARVRVMSIHAAKGLQFDAVVLPELDPELIGKPPAFVARRDPNTLAIDFVCRYANEKVQALLAPEDQTAFAEDRQQRVEESLSLLYVALTRAIRALYLFVPGPRKKEQNDVWYNLLISTLSPGVELVENTLLYQDSDPGWFQSLAQKESATAVPDEANPIEPIKFREVDTGRRRGLDQVAPSRREGGGQAPLSKLFEPSAGTGTAAGTLYHAWFALIGWLDNGLPTDKALRAEAEKLRADMPAGTWNQLDELLAKFNSWLQQPMIGAAFRRSAYANTQALGFPKALTSFWNKQFQPIKVEQERRFLVQDGDKLWNGSLDRVIWLGTGEQIVAADVIDFKTDDIPPGDEKALAARVEHYRPQMDAYRRAVSRLGHIDEKHVSVRLLFTTVGRIVDV